VVLSTTLPRSICTAAIVTAFIRQVVAGIEYSTATWQLETFRNTLQGTLVDNHINLPGLSDGIRLLEKGIENRKERERERS
jgi:deoxycytidylate deaminase